MWQQLAKTVEGIHFLHPGWLWAWFASFLILTLLLHAGHLESLMRLPGPFGAPPYRHPRLRLLRRLYAAHRRPVGARPRVRQSIVYGVLLLCLHAALAHPYRLGKQLPTPPEYRDTLFVIDTSISMELRDYLGREGERVDRMAILKSVLSHFVKTLEGNRISFIVFSERPYTLAPMTADHDLLASMVQRMKPAVLTGRTSDVGKALLYTVRQLEQSRAWDVPQKPALVLVSDVNRSYRDVDPRAVAAYLHQHGFRLHTIGIGAGSAEAREDLPAGLIYQPANFRLLKQIARSGGGQFYWADTADSLHAAVDAIQSAARRKVDVEPRYVTIPLYRWPLLAGLLWLMIIDLGFRSRRQT